MGGKIYCRRVVGVFVVGRGGGFGDQKRGVGEGGGQFEPGGRRLASVEVNGKPWKQFGGEWVQLPGDIGSATVVARYAKK